MTDNEEPKGAIQAEPETEAGTPVDESTSPEAAYEVGYGKPPQHSRFKPGESGNGRGRPKGAKNLKTHLVEVLNEKIVVREGDRTKKITKMEAFVTSLINGSIKGNGKSAGLLMATMMRLLDTGANDHDGEEDLSDDDLEVLRAQEARLMRRLLANQSPDPGPTTASEIAVETPREES